MTRRRSRSPTAKATALAGAPAQLAAMPAAAVELIAGDVTGLAALRELTGADAAPARGPGRGCGG